MTIVVAQLQRGARRLYAHHVSEVRTIEQGVTLAKEIGRCFVHDVDRPAWRNTPRRRSDYELVNPR
jgi:hypothetical protein